ncbi:MAG: ABC transporter ATP-binding protein [Hyphomicrobiales bacterium]|nr:ABC transporter ATP-binding protein [Hyphomicrobiales bacterium]MCP5001408.1 ABC transporter ATP-binding protein [Hyphomicrobiales bacterium]
MVLASMPVYFQMLQLPKLIVNGPIQGDGYGTPDSTQSFLSFDLPFSNVLFGQSITLFNGFQLDRQTMLIALCLAFLVAVAFNGWFKLYINTFKGKLGERLLRRLRYELFDRVLRYPIAKVRRLKPSEISSVIKDEIEPLGQFFGDAYSAPLFLGAQALTGLTFLFLQSTLFGLITLAIVLFQAWIIPLLRRRLLVLGRMRQTNARKLAGRIGEYVQGMDDVHLHGTSNRARANIWGMLRRILVIRFELYQRKFQVKFLNNFLIQFLAFLFYLVGGYLVITGRLDLGALVASIAAYKDLPSPIKGIIDWDQQRLFNQIRYEQAIDDFANTKVIAGDLQSPVDTPPTPIKTGFSLEQITVLDAHDQPIIENFSNAVSRGEAVAIVGNADSGAEQVAEMLARLLLTGFGKITLDDRDLGTLPEIVTGQRIGYADSSTFFAGGTVKSTLAETLPFAGTTPPIIDSTSSGAHFREFEIENLNIKPETLIAEADAYDEFSNWPNEESAPQLLALMQTVGLYDDILEYGLLRKLDEDASDDVRARIMDARSRFASDKTTQKIAEAVEFFDPQKYSHQLTIGENLIFGTPVDDDFGPELLPANKLVRKILDETSLLAPLFDVGYEIAKNNIELFGDLAEDSMLLQRSGGPSPEHLLEMKQAVEDLAGKNANTADESHIVGMLGLAFDYCEAQTRFGLVDGALQQQLLAARNKLRENLQQQDDDAIAFHDPERFNSSLSVLDNILFGRIDARRIGARERVLKSIKAMIESSGVSDTVFNIGLSFDIGTGGRNLSTNQAQKLKLVRALLKRPDIVIFNRALSALDAKERLKIIHNIVSTGNEGGQRQMGIVYVPLDNSGWDDFDRVLLMEHGRIAAEGTPEKISARLESAAQ